MQRKFVMIMMPFTKIVHRITYKDCTKNYLQRSCKGLLTKTVQRITYKDHAKDHSQRFYKGSLAEVVVRSTYKDSSIAHHCIRIVRCETLQGHATENLHGRKLSDACDHHKDGDFLPLQGIFTRKFINTKHLPR